MKFLKNLTITATLTMLLLTGDALAEKINSQILTQPNSPAEANCGSLALAYMLEKKGMASKAETVKNILPFSTKGHSVSDLENLSCRFGYSLKGIRLSDKALESIALPVLIHLKKGHYQVLEKIATGHLTIYDPQTKTRFKETLTSFSKRWSGVALISQHPGDGMRLTKEESGMLFGGSDGVSSIPKGDGDLGGGGGCGGGGPDGPPNDPDDPDGPDDDDPCGTPVWSVNKVNLNLYVLDIPFWYNPPVGPSVNIAISYNSQADITGNEPFGNKWQFKYGSYLVEDEDEDEEESGTVTVYMPDGRKDKFTPDGNGGYVRPYQVFNTLTKADNHFEICSPYDTVYVYNISSDRGTFLSEIRDAYDQSLTFSYIDGQLSTITDALGRNTTLTYLDGLVKRVDGPFGRFAEFEYKNRHLTRITDMGGYWTSLEYDESSYLSALGNDRGKTEFNIETSDDSTTAPDYPAPGDSMGPSYRITVTDPLGEKKEYYYNGRTGYGWYVSPNNYIEYVDENNNNFAKDVPKTLYNYANTIKGQREDILSITWPEGKYISYTYDPDTDDRLTRTDAHSTTVYTYNDMGRITSITDPKGNVTTLNYDPANNVDLLQSVNGLGTITMTYNDAHDMTSITDRLDNTTTIHYNSYGQITSYIDASDIATIYTHYDNHQLHQITIDGNIRETLTYDNIGRIRTRQDATGLVLTYDYNNLNHITRTTYPDDKFISYVYSDCCPRLLDSVTDRSGRTTNYKYNALKKLTKTINPEGGITRLIYDANRNIVQQIDPNSNITTFNYDLENRVIKKTYADGTPVIFDYYDTGLLRERINARGIRTRYYYDENNNLTFIDYFDNTPDVDINHDNYNRRTDIQDGTGAYHITYDESPHLFTYTVDGPWENDTQTYQYNTPARKVDITRQGGESLTYLYDSLLRLQTVQTGTDSYTYGYNGANTLVQSLTRPNGSITSYQYNTLNQLKEITNKNSSDEIINQYVYEYDQKDQRTKETITNGLPATGLQNELITCNYNTVNQLLNSTNPDKDFKYDADGNMTKGYTPEGYIFTAVYDAENRLKSIEYTDSASIVHKTEYIYRSDSFLARIKRYENNTLVDDTRIIRDGFLPVQERDANNNTVREYAWGLNMGGGIGGLLNLKQSGQNYAYLYDGKGNVTSVLDNSQAMVASYRYDAFGKLMSKTGALNQPFMFSTKRYDAGSGLSYYGYRFYSPTIGRWITKDPIGEAGGINLYGFVLNNPVNAVDPLGLYGTNDCSYYEKRCKEIGGKYYCKIAKKYCNKFPKFPDPDTSKDDDYEGWFRCTRKCLQDCDAENTEDKCQKDVDEFREHWDCHYKCYIECGKGKITGKNPY